MLYEFINQLYVGFFLFLQFIYTHLKAILTALFMKFLSYFRTHLKHTKLTYVDSRTMNIFKLNNKNKVFLLHNRNIRKEYNTELKKKLSIKQC